MKTKNIWIVGLLSLVFLSACTKQTSTQVVFDTYHMTRFLDDKIYRQTPIEASWQNITIYQSQQEGTGTTNSLVINRVPLMSWVSLTQVVDLNMQQVKESLSKYTQLSSRTTKIACGNQQLTGYYVTFQYFLNEKQPFYVGQYFFASQETLYLISFHTATKADLGSLSQSITTLSCK